MTKSAGRAGRAEYRAYTPQDMMKVREYISRVYSRLKRLNSWSIARWEFEIFFIHKRAGMLRGWEQHIGLWEDEAGELAAVVCRDGDYYFQLDTLEPQEELLSEMFGFIEKSSSPDSPKLAIPKFMPALEAMARSRGYKLLRNESDNIISVALDQEFRADLPHGFTFCCGDEVSDRAKAQGHIMAFDYAGTKKAEQTLQHYGGLREAPGYRPGLDLSLVNAAGEVVAFCNIFVDEANRIGILEPVGTHVNYRRQGLGRAVIYEGLNRLRTLGMVKAYTGPMQPFYRRIGFALEAEMTIWEKERG
jgi:predicted N-acetyltransferase YhbS